MDRRTAGIVGTLVAVLLCGCPGLVFLCLGATSALASAVPGAEIDVFGSNDPQSAMNAGLAALCLGVLFVLIPIVVGIVTLRNRPPAALQPAPPPYTPPPSPPPFTPPPSTYTPPAEPPSPPPPTYTPPAASDFGAPSSGAATYPAPPPPPDRPFEEPPDEPLPPAS